jgi:hypothetical protein
MPSERKVLLQENHRRSFTSTLIIVEQLLIEIEDLMVSQYKTCCFEIKNDLDSEKISHNLKVIEEHRYAYSEYAEDN